MRCFWIIALVFLVSSCASKTVPIHYYLLDAPVDAPSLYSASNIDVKVSLPHYLKQDGLVMQDQGHKLLVSRQHLWAQPIDQDIANIVQRHLSNKNKSHLALTIDLELKHLLIQSGKGVLIQANYKVENLTEGAVQQGQFTQLIALSEDGYHHGVEQMKAAVYALSNHINTQLDNT